MAVIVAATRIPRARPRSGSASIALRLAPEELASLDKFCAKQGGISRQEGIRLLLRDGLLDADAMPADDAQDSRIKSPDEIAAQQGE